MTVPVSVPSARTERSTARRQHGRAPARPAGTVRRHHTGVGRDRTGADVPAERERAHDGGRTADGRVVTRALTVAVAPHDITFGRGPVVLLDRDRLVEVEVEVRVVAPGGGGGREVAPGGGGGREVAPGGGGGREVVQRTGRPAEAPGDADHVLASAIMGIPAAVRGSRRHPAVGAVPASSGPPAAPGSPAPRRQ